MDKIIREIVLDVSKRDAQITVAAKQYDVNSRFLRIILKDGSEQLRVDENAVVTVSAKRFGGKGKMFRGEVNDDGSITVPITGWMTKESGVLRCDVSVVDPYGESRLSSMSFQIIVEIAAVSNKDMHDDKNFDLLVSLISDCEKAASDVDAAAEKAGEAVKSAEKAVEDAKEAVKTAGRWKNVTATVEMLDESAEPVVELTDTDGGKALSFSLPRGFKGEKGVMFTPCVDESGNLSWSNDGGLDNPETVNVKGPKGDRGEKGETGAPGADGHTPSLGVDYFTEADKADIVVRVLGSLPVGEEMRF